MKYFHVVKVDIIKECKAKKTLQNNYGEMKKNCLQAPSYSLNISYKILNHLFYELLLIDLDNTPSEVILSVLI